MPQTNPLDYPSAGAPGISGLIPHENIGIDPLAAFDSPHLYPTPQQPTEYQPPTNDSVINPYTQGQAVLPNYQPNSIQNQYPLGDGVLLIQNANNQWQLVQGDRIIEIGENQLGYIFSLLDTGYTGNSIIDGLLQYFNNPGLPAYDVSAQSIQY